MKILHTSDWHLGRTLYGRKCHEEFAFFLDWLADEISRRKVDCLLIAGDVFDSTTPANTVQSLYYSFLHRISGSCCRHVVITGGNHDSPSLLNAPRQLLKHLNVTVVGSATDDPDDEVVGIYDPEGRLEAVVCAVPYLRDRDVRRSEAGESIEDKARKLVEGIAEHYKTVCDRALRLKHSAPQAVPLIAMGHLFTAGGKTADGDEVRDLYVGTLAHVHSTAFPPSIDYLALGHLHIAQSVDGDETRRYCGSPLQLSFAQNDVEKSVTIVTFENGVTVETVPVPPFLRLRTLRGDYQTIHDNLQQLIRDELPLLVEAHYSGPDVHALYEELRERVSGTKVELLRVVNQSLAEHSLRLQDDGETLENLSEVEVFRRCLESHDIEAAEREELEYCFRQVLQEIAEEDPRGEAP